MYVLYLLSGEREWGNIKGVTAFNEQTSHRVNYNYQNSFITLIRSQWQMNTRVGGWKKGKYGKAVLLAITASLLNSSARRHPTAMDGGRQQKQASVFQMLTPSSGAAGWLAGILVVYISSTSIGHGMARPLQPLLLLTLPSASSSS